MISYELAKELKDVGFPQSGPPSRFLWQPTDKPNVMDNGVYCPTLSELIEACGDRFEQLKRINDVMWYADGEPHPDHSYRAAFSSPEEAVARLWLALRATA
jgi:hypothetical protein